MNDARSRNPASPRILLLAAALFAAAAGSFAADPPGQQIVLELTGMR